MNACTLQHLPLADMITLSRNVTQSKPEAFTITLLHNIIILNKGFSVTSHLGGLVVVESIPAVEFRL
jgi:hypothetical protein